MASPRPYELRAGVFMSATSGAGRSLPEVIASTIVSSSSAVDMTPPLPPLPNPVRSSVTSAGEDPGVKSS